MAEFRSPGIPVLLKAAYTLFVVFLVPYYCLIYSPWNFLNFCDIALLVMMPAIWIESRFLVSLEAVSVLFPQILWILDYCIQLAGGHLLGLTGYMFNPESSAVARGMSFFHAWMPVLLIYLLFRLGYDRRALVWQSVIAVGVLLLSLAMAPVPPAPVNRPHLSVNVNFVWGLSDRQPQTWMPHWLYLVLLIAVYLVGIYLPTHVVLGKLFKVERTGQPMGSRLRAEASTRAAPGRAA